MEIVPGMVWSVSGAIYWGVPIVLLTWFEPINSDDPKSQSIGFPVDDKRMFSNLRSLWTMPYLWIESTAIIRSLHISYDL